MNAVIEAEGVSRWYGEVMGVNSLSATVRPGTTGILGPNGAGKSTFLKLVTGQLRPSRGRLTVLGLAPFASRPLHQRLGYCPEVDALYPDLTGLAFVTYTMRLHGMGTAEARAAASRALDRVGLSEVAGRRTGGYSKGMRQRVKLAQAIAHEPELLVLDEPLAGLDPVGRLHLISLLRELGGRGTHVLMSSHVLHEIEALTEEVLLLHRGRILADGTVPEIRRLLRRHPHKVEIGARDLRGLARRLLGEEEVVAVRLDEARGRLVVETRDLEALQRRLPALVSEARPGVRSCETVDAGLEAVFEYLVS